MSSTPGPTHRSRSPKAARLSLAALLAALLAVSSCGAEEGGADDAHSGTGRMAERLASLAEASDPMANVYRNAERVERMRARGPSAGRESQHAFRLANELLLDGRTEEAIEGFRALSAALPPDSWQPLLATAYLRLGEQENCVANHGTHSCILPIREEGRHTLTRGSESAVELFEEHLARRPDDLGSRWLLNIAYMTLGRWPEEVPEAWRLPREAFASQDDIGRFTDVATRVGTDVTGLAGASIVDDFDEDGDFDLFVTSGGMRDPAHYFENTGGAFTDRSERAGLDGIVGGLNAVHADADGDGHLDVLVLRGGWLGVPPCTDGGEHPNSLLVGDGTGLFTDVTEAAGLLSFHPTQTASFSDTDLDGDLDLFVGNESASAAHACEFFENAGDGTFRERARDVGLNVVGLVKASSFGDYDNDGKDDLFVSRLGQANLLFHNAGGRFVERAVAAGVVEPRASFPTWWFDYDNDGWLDLFVSGYGTTGQDALAALLAEALDRPHEAETPRLYRNRGDGTFENVTARAGLDRVAFTMGCNFGDLDNDGWLDLYLATGDPQLRSIMPNLAFRNSAGPNADRRFLDVTTSGGFGHLQKGHGVSFADLDGDGDQDVHVNVGGFHSGDVYQNVLFENPGHGRHWIALDLVGRGANRFGLGARVRLDVATEGGTRTLHRRVSSGGSFGGSPFRLEVGLDDASVVERLEIRWPGGSTQVLEDLAADRVWRVVEGRDRPTPLRVSATPFTEPASGHRGHH